MSSSKHLHATPTPMEKVKGGGRATKMQEGLKKVASSSKSMTEAATARFEELPDLDAGEGDGKGSREEAGAKEPFFQGASKADDVFVWCN